LNHFTVPLATVASMLHLNDIKSAARGNVL
jgi:hypothetical protein